MKCFASSLMNGLYLLNEEKDILNIVYIKDRPNDTNKVVRIGFYVVSKSTGGIRSYDWIVASDNLTNLQN